MANNEVSLLDGAGQRAVTLKLSVNRPGAAYE